MRFILYVETGFVGARHEDEIEIDDAEWNDMSKDEQEKYLNEAAVDYMHDRIECGWEAVKVQS